MICLEYPVASVVTASVYHGIHRRLLGQHRFEFLSRHDTFYRLLYEALDPVKFMCESLQISPAEVEGLDTALAETLRQNAPEGFDLLGVHKNVPGKLVHHDNFLQVILLSGRNNSNSMRCQWIDK